MAKKTFTPQQLKKTLIAMFILLIVGSAGVFYLTLGAFKEYAVEVNHRLQDAEASGKQIEQLQSLKGQLDQSQQLIAKSNQLFSTPDQYQTNAQTDIQAIAQRSGVAIAGTEFADGSNPADMYTVTVRLGSPVQYSQLIQFFDGIEGNLPKMQVVSATFTNIQGGGANTVGVEDIKIKLTVR